MGCGRSFLAALLRQGQSEFLSELLYRQRPCTSCFRHRALKPPILIARLLLFKLQRQSFHARRETTIGQGSFRNTNAGITSRKKCGAIIVAAC
jgi:hypothetical protein